MCYYKFVVVASTVSCVSVCTEFTNEKIVDRRNVPVYVLRKYINKLEKHGQIRLMVISALTFLSRTFSTRVYRTFVRIYSVLYATTNRSDSGMWLNYFHIFPERNWILHKSKFGIPPDQTASIEKPTGAQTRATQKPYICMFVCELLLWRTIPRYLWRR